MAEEVNTNAVALPVVEFLYFHTDSGTTHLVNPVTGYENRPYPSDRSEGETYTVDSMCGRASVEVPHMDSLDDADNLIHIGDTLTPDVLNENPSLMNSPWNILDNVCGSCEASIKSAFENSNYQTFRFEL